MLSGIFSGLCFERLCDLCQALPKIFPRFPLLTVNICSFFNCTYVAEMYIFFSATVVIFSGLFTHYISVLYT